MKNSLKTICRNKKAYHDYNVIENFEAGIELFGTEVKSLRLGRVNLKDSWCSVTKGQLFLNKMHISHYKQGNIFNRNPTRVRRLLAHKREIMRLYGTIKQQGYSLVPLSVYLKGSLFKVQVGLCKGKKLYDKRRAIAEKTAKRDMQRAFKQF
ncbi:MAG: SsrA-binding protein SmpB [Oscillospiraceae bacterium]|jgi:SsrA-binding protein|nr:SsrA-binding protein SmpB [Oscillospiraceae bacterium]